MRVLHISKYYPPEAGGIETFVSDLVDQMSRKVKCDVLCTNKGNKTIIEKKGDVRIIRTATLREIFSTPISSAIIYWLKKINRGYDLIHIHLPNPMANLAYFLVRPKTKLIVHWHSDIVRQKRLLFLYEPLQDWLLKRADKIIATSSNYLESSKYLLKYKNKCMIVPLGLNPTRLYSDKNNVFEIKNKFNNKPIIFSIGRLIYYKGFEYLIKAMQIIDGCLLIGGEGELKNKLKSLIEKLNLQKKVFLLGKVPHKDLGSYYQSCDVFCLPSVEKSEAFGIAQLEAMSFGKPIISTKIHGSGVSFVNKDNITGFVVPPRNHKALAEAINKLLKDNKLKDIFGKNAKERFEKNFSIEKTCEEILKIYKELYRKVFTSRYNKDTERLKIFLNYEPHNLISGYLSREEMKKNILFLTYRLPNPEMRDGYAIRVLNIAKILKAKYKVDLVSVYRTEEELNYNEKLGKIFDNITLFKKGNYSFLKGALKGLFSQNSIQEGIYYLSLMKRWVEDHFRDYELVFCNTLRTAGYVENLKIKKVIDLIESLTLKYSDAKKYVNPVWKLIYSIEIPRLLRREKEITKIFDKVFISSEFDKNYIEGQTMDNWQLMTGDRRKEKIIVVPNGIKEELLTENREQRTKNRKEENWVSFFGKMDYQPNEDAALWFANKVFPIVKEKIKDAIFFIIGTNPTRKIKQLRKINGVKVTEFLTNPYSIIKKSKVVVVPLRFGAGIQNKILEAMTLGKVVLSSVVGERGTVGANKGEHFEVVNSFDARLWAEKIIEFLRDSQKRLKLGRQAEKLIEENFRWEKIGRKLLEEIDKIIQ